MWCSDSNTTTTTTTTTKKTTTTTTTDTTATTFFIQKNLSIVETFFFQAEDGIRALTVTGVQTCALPIYVGDVRVMMCGLAGICADDAGTNAAQNVGPQVAGNAGSAQARQ